MAGCTKGIKLLLLSVAIVAPSISHAWFWSGYKLKEMCEAQLRTEMGNFRDSDFQSAARLQGFVIAIHDAFDGSLICSPDDAKVGQMTGVVSKYVLENPDKWNRGGATLALTALSRAFPCKR